MEQRDPIVIGAFERIADALVTYKTHIIDRAIGHVLQGVDPREAVLRELREVLEAPAAE